MIYLTESITITNKKGNDANSDERIIKINEMLKADYDISHTS